MDMKNHKIQSDRIQRNSEMEDLNQKLQNLEKEHDFLVGIDSDGCAFDTMEIKHKECFIPNTINEWGLQAISKFVRETAEFVNLYSRWRDMNRFPALINVFDLLEDRIEVKKRNFILPKVDSLRKWVVSEERLSDPSLEKKILESKDPVLIKTLRWSKTVNETVKKIVKGVPPFPFVPDSLKKMKNKVDVAVVSSAPITDLEREWNEQGLIRHVKLIAGQEMGSKTEILATVNNGKYDPEKVIMIGDAINDMNAAKNNGVLFYPINPGDEDFSWQRFYKESFDRFVGGTYKGVYEEKLIVEFEKYIPWLPPWKK